MCRTPSLLGGWGAGIAEVPGLSQSFWGSESQALLPIYSFVSAFLIFFSFTYSAKAVDRLKCLKWKWTYLSPVWLCVTQWTIGCQAPLSRGFSRQEYWTGLPFPSPGDLPDPEVECASLALQADSLSSSKWWICSIQIIHLWTDNSIW